MADETKVEITEREFETAEMAIEGLRGVVVLAMAALEDRGMIQLVEELRNTAQGHDEHYDLFCAEVRKRLRAKKGPFGRLM